MCCWPTPEELLPGISVTALEPLPSAVLKGDARMAAVLARAVYNIKKVPTTVAVLPFDRYELRLTRAQALGARRSAIATRQPHNLARPRFARAVLRQLARQFEGADPTNPGICSVNCSPPTSSGKRWTPCGRCAPPSRCSASSSPIPRCSAAAAPELVEAERALLARPAGSGWTTSDIPLLDELAELLGDPAELARAAEERRRRASEREYAEGVLTIIGMSDEVSADALADRFNTRGRRGHGRRARSR